MAKPDNEKKPDPRTATKREEKPDANAPRNNKME